ncbi:hypothetical protein GO730_26800 [Spirosoma sp. HMF3257]|uniref:Uncharacterized protein n=1 Tax=Spirosoma telluris TaxID=2183553 RepID=A0A327NNF7_9BACT|nr:hypothetical protein [Spirosoma telluris]RAI76870.1 hypothetical protein HMF3257_26725 [Spirosoma telluris]
MIPTLYLSFHRQRTWTYLLTGLLLCLLIGSRLWAAPTTAPVRFSGLPVWAINPTGVSQQPPIW